ncbi:MAG: TolC family protein [Phycisphaerae bacterium]|nr:TolC family protein [Gemmatimonadaceae bacterium]
MTRHPWSLSPPTGLLRRQYQLFGIRASVALPVVSLALQLGVVSQNAGAQQVTPTAPTATVAAGRRLTLAEALSLATRANESVELAKAGVLRSRGQQLQARSAALPQLSTSLNYQKTLQNQFEAISSRTAPATPDTGTGGGESLADNPLTRIFASPYTTTFTITGSQTLYSGGRNTANARAANAGRQSAEIGVVSAGAQLTLDVTQAYYDAVLSDNLVAIAESALVQTERTLRATGLGQQVGSTSEFDLIRARVTRDNQRPQYLQSRTARDLSYVRLKQLLDVPINEPLSLVDDIEQQEGFANATPRTQAPVSQSLIVNPAELTATDPRVTQAVNAVVAVSDTMSMSRASVRQANAAVEMAQQQLKAAKAGRLPTIGLTSTYQRLAYPSDGIPRSLGDFFPNWTAGVGVSFPFFTGGRVKGETMAAEASVVEAQQRLLQARENATLDARQSVAQLLEAEEGWQASIGTTEQAARAYSIAEVRFREGISTQVELSESRVQLQQAQANRARAARDLQVARVRLKLLRDLPVSGGAGATMTGTSGAGAAGGAATSGSQRSGQAGASSPTGPTPGGNTP